MHAMTKGMEPPVDDAPERETSAGTQSRVPTVIWVHDGPVCVEILDFTPVAAPSPHCTCGACAATQHAEWADRFLK